MAPDGRTLSWQEKMGYVCFIMKEFKLNIHCFIDPFEPTRKFCNFAFCCKDGFQWPKQYKAEDHFCGKKPFNGMV